VIRGLRVPVHLTSREALRIFDLADIWATRTGQEVRLVSANDHVHARGSAHYQGLALDFHTSDPDGLSATLREAGYHVLWRVPGHHGHVHVEPGGPESVQPRPLHPDTSTVRPAPKRASSRAAGRRTRSRSGKGE
jgi:hypothetical protein